MRIYLTGFMGAGKTVVGRALAELLGYRFLDLDQAIEEVAGKSVRQIFEEDGEGRFRDLEQECLQATAKLQDVVVATGGGTITFERNLATLRRLGLSVWINPSFATLLERIGVYGKEDRPLFRSESQAFELFRLRLAAYQKADLRVDVGPGETPAEVAARIQFLLRERRCAI